jgi:hypothetical protein
MSGFIDWVTRPWRNLNEAKMELEKSEGDRERVKILAEELRRIQHENHISARVHAAFRGDAP